MNILEILENSTKKPAAKVKLPSGLILHEDANNIVIVTFNSKNEKIGDMAQIWILVKAMRPTDASANALDFSNCGNCKHRHSLGGSCYVNLGQAPNSVWKAWQKGNYADIKKVPNWLDYFKGIAVRFGAYGDPAFIPLDIVKQISNVASKWTGYTHQWNDPTINMEKEYMSFFMASVDDEVEHLQALTLGYRSFKVVTNEYELDKKREIVCPNLTHGISCLDCGLCNGIGKAKDIVVLVHGYRKNYFKAA